MTWLGHLFRQGYVTFDEFLCFKEEEDGKIMHTERHETFASLNSMST